MENYSYETLRGIVGEQVTIEDKQGNEVSITLSEVNKGKIDGPDWEAFSAIYQGQNEFFIPQGTYTLKHPSFGEQQLFLSPNSETEYETVVTRERRDKHHVAAS
ncbi:DUF6916 family protein [Pleionea sediminis]|uniref:DUF6916 family protein n=1 Tax=Pleionea sediminis TaxID=2569479 RepID=UPI001186B868|nr:hypothetical protein [Pleionea sediminis]